MNNEANSYSEVYCFLNLLGDKYINMLPRKLYKFFEENRNPDYYINIDINKELIPQFKFSATEPIIEYLNLQYWCTPNEKQELLKQYQANEIRYQEELKAKYDTNNLFKNKQMVKQPSSKENNMEKQEEYDKKETKENEKQLILKESIFEKIKKFIYRLFHKN